MDALATIVAALLGAAIGSLGAQWLGERYRRAQVTQATRREVAVRHLVQLQDAIVSLWFRLHNITYKGGRSVMGAGYYETSTAYVLANFLAHKRLLTIEGAYAKLDVFGDDFAGQLESALEGLEAAVGDDTFYRYQRRALGELLVKWDGIWRVLTYTEFVAVAHNDETLPAVEPALRFLKGMSKSQASTILDDALSALSLLEQATGLQLPNAIARTTRIKDPVAKRPRTN